MTGHILWIDVHVDYYFYKDLLDCNIFITFIGVELQGLPSPASHRLWKASTRQEWETAYDLDRRTWIEAFCINELWPVPVDLDESEILIKRSRVDQWLEDVDEFGTMLYAITCSTHGT